MKKILKRLLTGVLTLTTVFTALPVTQVHAADSVYTTTDGKAGTIVKVDNISSISMWIQVGIGYRGTGWTVSERVFSMACTLSQTLSGR